MDDIGDVWTELMTGNPKFAAAFFGAFLFVVSGDWGSLLLASAFGYSWAKSDDNILAVGI